MATLFALQEEIELELKLVEMEYDPFQVDLEWFKYELAIKIKRAGQASLPNDAAGKRATARRERHGARGKINRKDFSILLSGLDDLIQCGLELRYEPYDLNFYMEWKMETPHVYSIVTWFDLALSPRDLNSRFPSAHVGFRFLAEEDSLSAFRSGLEAEFIGSRPISDGNAPGLIN